MFGSHKYRSWLAHPGYNKKDSDAPDYTPMANASAESAKIAGELGQKQLDFAKQQYAEAKPLYQQLVDQQVDIANKSAAQGDDYYNYQKSYRPVEQALMYESMGLTPDQLDAMRAEQKTAAQGILSGLVDETPYQADLEAARAALGHTPQQVTSSSSSTTTTGATGATGTTASAQNSVVRALSAKTKQTPGYDATKSVTENVQTLTQSNPEFAAAVAKLTDSQKQALMVKLQNEQIRERAAQTEADVFNKYSGQASRTEAQRIAEFDAANKADAALITGSNGTLYDARKAEIEQDVGRATADVNQGYAAARAQQNRDLMSMGVNPNSGRFASANRGLMFDQARSLAGAANTTRMTSLNDVRNRVATGLQLRQSNMNASNAQKAIGWAKKLDATGLVKGMPGASSGAYGLAVSAGNSAGQNQTAPGAQYQAGLGQGAGTIMQGRQLYQSGLGSVLNAQVNSQQPDQTGSVIGSVAGVAAAFL